MTLPAAIYRKRQAVRQLRLFLARPTKTKFGVLGLFHLKMVCALAPC